MLLGTRLWLECMSGETCATERLVGCRLVRTHTSLERKKYKQVEREAENPVGRPTDWRLEIGRTVVINILCSSSSASEYISTIIEPFLVRSQKHCCKGKQRILATVCNYFHHVLFIDVSLFLHIYLSLSLSIPSRRSNNRRPHTDSEYVNMSSPSRLNNTWAPHNLIPGLHCRLHGVLHCGTKWRWDFSLFWLGTGQVR